MTFSVIIPAYNASKTIRKTLDSIYSQTFKDFECIVIADSCTDNTADIAKEYGATVITTDARCEGVGRNIGIERSKGEWILFIDADDWYLHEYVFEMLASRIKDNNCDAVAFDIVWKHVGVVGPISGRNNQYFPHCTNKCWRRTFIGDTRFPNIRPDSDAGFHKEIMKKNPNFDVWDMPMYYYDFLRPDSYSDNLGRTAEMAVKWWRIEK